MDEAGHVLDVQVERVMRASTARLGYEWRRARRREKQLAGTLLHLSRELQSCPSNGHTVTLLGLLAGGRGPIPAPSAIAGVVTRVGSLERSVEFHEQAILELERQATVVDMLDTRVEETQREVAELDKKLEKSVRSAQKLSDLAVETQREVAELGKKLEKSARGAKKLSDLAEETQQEVAELEKKLEKSMRDTKKLFDFAEIRHQVMAGLDKNLHESLRDMELQLTRRVTNLEQWGDDIAKSLNAVKDRVEYLGRGW